VQGSEVGSLWSAICRAVGIQPGTPAVLVAESETPAEPVSQVVWTSDLIGQLDARDPAAGETVAELCIGCHGDADDPQADPLYPKLAGQSALAIYKQMHDFGSGSRPSDFMTPIVESPDEDAILDVSAYYASLGRGTLDPDVAVLDDAETAQLINRGDPARGIPACVSCHGTRSGGPMETPTIAGQNADYLAAQLRAYADGSRRNDVYARMRTIAAALTEDEIIRVSAYYAGVPQQ
jgi:cytochrome c553